MIRLSTHERNLLKDERKLIVCAEMNTVWLLVPCPRYGEASVPRPHGGTRAAPCDAPGGAAGTRGTLTRHTHVLAAVLQYLVLGAAGARSARSVAASAWGAPWQRSERAAAGAGYTAHGGATRRCLSHTSP